MSRFVQGAVLGLKQEKTYVGWMGRRQTEASGLGEKGEIGWGGGNGFVENRGKNL